MGAISFEYSDSFRESLVTYWAHRPLSGGVWNVAGSHSPELPSAIPGKGFCRCLIEYESNVLEFASVHEIEHVVEVLELRLLPTTVRLSKLVSGTSGPSAHWLSRIPLKSKSFKNRQRLVKLLRKAIMEYPVNAS